MAKSKAGAKARPGRPTEVKPATVDGPIRRNDRRRLRTREALLQAASEIFREQGVDSATVAEIASRADVAHGSLYNHFSGVHEIIAVLARQSVQRMLDETREIMAEVSDARLLPCVGARLIMRTFARDVAIRWMLDRPYVFATTFQEAASPFMHSFEGPGIQRGALNPAAGHEVWIRTLPWILISELSHAISDTPRKAQRYEESCARICMRLLGVEDRDAENLLERSLDLVKRHGH